ncbi:hypothetical protein LWI28_028518 [Acer negundo]|uniref:Uncharacterized protein n=1 Tax=Acer negundo TaxID=4023 RepID=A0AAD5NV97_ACENE|nr:hypothetical protein LWI28_028518 [Acer negundo]
MAKAAWLLILHFYDYTLELRMSRLKLRASMASMFLCAKGNLIALLRSFEHNSCSKLLNFQHQGLSTISVPGLLPRCPKLRKFTNAIPVTSCPVRVKHPPICCTKLTPWEPSPAKQAPAENAGYDFL